jgi:hypothetical protein
MSAEGTIAIIAGSALPGFGLASSPATALWRGPVLRLPAADTGEEIYRLYGEHVRIIEVLVRQAHPGERHGAYRSDEAKLDDARAYQREERIPWPVLIDDLAGTVQRAYGGLAAAVYLIDSRGIVSFCGVWGQSPALRVAIDDLLARDGTGSPAGKGTDRRPHLAAAIVAGQRGPVRGGRQALVDGVLGAATAIGLRLRHRPHDGPD